MSTEYFDANGNTEYMAERDYDELQDAADWLNNCESDLNELRAAFGALYRENSRSVSRQDFEDAISAFEQSQRFLIARLDALLP